MTKRVVVFSLCAFTLLPVMGQDAIEAYKKQKKKEFTTYVQNKQQQLDEYRRKKNQEFAAYMEGHKWEAFDKKKAIEQPLEKDVPPVFFDEKEGQQEEKEFSVERRATALSFITALHLRSDGAICLPFIYRETMREQWPRPTGN